MGYLLAFLKWFLVLIVMLAGIGLLLAGLNVEVPLIKFKGLEAQGVPVGLIVMGIGVALAYFWRVIIHHKDDYYPPAYPPAEDDSGNTSRASSESTIRFKELR